MKHIVSEIADQFYDQIMSNYFFADYFAGKDMDHIKKHLKDYIYDQLTCDPNDLNFQKSYNLGVMHANKGIPLNNVMSFMDHFQNRIFEYCKDTPEQCEDLVPSNIKHIRNWFAKGYLFETIKNTDLISIPLFSVLSSTKIATSIISWMMAINTTILHSDETAEINPSEASYTLMSFIEKPFFNMIFETEDNYFEFNKMYLELHNIANSLMYFIDKQDYIQSYYIYNDFIEHCRKFMNFHFERVVLFEQNIENYFYRFVKKKIENGRSLTFFIFNIRNMNIINKIWGHENGDFVVHEVERVIDKMHGMNSRKSVFIRTHNAEFIVLLIDTDKDEALNDFIRLENKLTTSIPRRGEFHSDIKISSIFMHMGHDAEIYKDLLMQVMQQGIALAKMNGTKPLICGENEFLDINNRVLNEEKIKHFIRQSFNKDNFEPFYHTIVSASKQKAFSVEVLARVCDGRNCVSAASFIDYLIQTERIIELDKVMLEKVSNDIDKLKKIVTNIFLNISPKSLRSPSYIAKLDEFINLTDNKNVNIVFEITEQSLFDNIELVRMLHDKYGSVFAIDDFGSGYSNFSIVSDLAQEGLIEYLKIDGTLIRNITTNVYKENIVSGIIKIAKSLELKTVAEFVADEKTAKKLIKLGISHLQGFHYSMPVSIDDI